VSRRPTVVHCFATKLETLCDECERVHGNGAFVGSVVWRATLARDWRDGLCMRDAGHAGPCVFEELGGEKERKRAS
jgi:hypothetical protein